MFRSKIYIMNTKQHLKAVKSLLSDKRRWTQKHLARNEEGWPVVPLSSNANCWCLLGALCKTRLEQNVDADSDAYTTLLRCAGKPLASFNDSATHEEVLELVEKAIISLPRRK